MTETPVALTIFNRPKQTARILEAIQSACPSRLFVIADGPRPDHPRDAELCAAARSLVDKADLQSDVVHHYSDSNLGAGRRAITGLEWLFAQIDEAIILEDDCLPDPTFFSFCDELLTRYRDDPRVVMIAGANPLGRWRAGEQSYHFSCYGCHWGWATWKRAWKIFDAGPARWDHPSTRDRLQSVIGDPDEFGLYWRRVQQTHRSGSWDCQWSLTHRLGGGLAAAPAVNLISNTGFGGQSTHTGFPLALGANAVRYSMRFPLNPPATTAADREFDREYLRWLLGEPSADSIAAMAELQIGAGRLARGLLLVEAALRSRAIDMAGAVPRLRILKEEALRRLAAKNR
ncbi:MAG: glycosyltransferase family 2 protein [Bryobacteraceae bacterium]|nr:glycosyltransferase family 2 protein [Bryobacteraceae bacterium]